MDKILNFVKKNSKIIITLSVLIVVNFLLLYDNLHTLSTAIFFGITTIIQIVLTIVCFKKIKKIENLFLILAIPLGILYMIVLPIGKAPDEPLHFLRAYEVSQGKLISDQDKKDNGVGNFTESIYDTIADDDFSYKDTLSDLKKEDSNKKRKYIYTTLSLYSFVCYIPQSIGMFITRIFNAPVLVQAYGARLFNLITFVTMVYFALKIIPYKKFSLFFIGFIPLVLQEASSMSADCLTIASAILLISYILNVSSKKGKITFKQELIITLLSILVSLCKIVYVPLCLLTLVISKEKYKSTKQKFFKTAIICLICCIVSGIWLKIASRYLVEFQKGVDVSSQVKWALSNPLGYILILFRTLRVEFYNYIFNLTGNNLGCLDIGITGLYSIPALIIMTLIFLSDKSEKKLNNKTLFIISGVFIVISVLIFSSIYAQWTSYKNPYVVGVQGRYFYPILILVPFLFERIKINSEIDNKYIYAFIISYNLFALNTVFSLF